MEMEMAIVNFEAVAKAANELEAAGQRASVRAVRDKLGAGSPNMVLKFLSEWRGGRPLVRIEDTTLDAAITTAIAGQMQRVAKEAASAAEERATATEDDLQTLSEAQHELDQQIDSLTAERDQARVSADAAQNRLVELEAISTRENQHSLQQIAELRKDLTEAHRHNEQTAAQLGKAEVRLEALPGLHADIDRLRGQLDTEHKARTAAEQTAAVLTARLEAHEKETSEAHAQAAGADARAAVAEARAIAAEARIEVIQAKLVSLLPQPEERKIPQDSPKQ